LRRYIKEDGEVMESEFFDTRQAFLSLCQAGAYTRSLFSST
jgi:hypothetical protein